MILAFFSPSWIQTLHTTRSAADTMDNFKSIVISEIKGLRPSFLAKKPHFNFISVHYFWIIGLTVVGSILIYGPGQGNIKYIDALTFAAGGSTQAGLNTIDVNKLNTFQQVVLYILASLANPITINSFVVILRLYWFEKRFQHIARDARMRRRTMSKSKSKAVDDPSRLERGVNGRHITVIHDSSNSRVANDGTYLGPTAAAGQNATGDKSDGNGTSGTSAETIARTSTSDARQELRRPEIKFAPTVKRSDGLDDDVIKLPQRLSDEEHIAILERQRNPVDDEVLHIPGPRDAERGVLPSRIVRRASNAADEEPKSPDSTKARDASPASTRTGSLPDAERHATADTATDANHPAGHPDHERTRLNQAITIQEPKKPVEDDFADDARAFVNVLTSFRLRRNPFAEVKKHPLPKHFGRRPTLQSLRTAFSRDKDGDPAPYLSWQPTLGRNSVFLGMSEEQREELGGIEYRSLKTLAIVLLIYFWGFWLLGTVCLVPWIVRSDKYGAVVDEVEQGRVWWGFFTAHSSFMDLGYTLTPDSMNSFNTAVFPLLLISFLIVIGNTGFPVMLRFVIWIFSLVVPRDSGAFEELKFLLDHPRRCFTLLFPSGATWWLFWLLVILNGIDLLFYCVLDLGSGPIMKMPPGVRVLDGLFQAFSTRTAGFSCVNLADLHPAVQASYMIMMYISVFPIAISVRRTNVYEEKSLGIYNSNDVDDPNNGTDMEYVGAHLRRQLSFDLWFLSIGFFILTISEGTRLMENDYAMFAVLFEVVSAYGTVGLSLGYTGVNASLCSQFSVIGKLVIIAMMIRGRHRGLPYGLDRAILLPSESLNAKEAAMDEARNGPMLISPATRRGSGTSGGLQGSQPLHAVTSNRERGRSRSKDRNNTNILSQFLHPGPTMARSSVCMPHVYRTFSESAVDEANRSRARTTGIDIPGPDGKPQL